MWNHFARPWEERDLAARFGLQFEDYRKQVRCWIPRLTAYPAITADGQSEDAHKSSSDNLVSG